VEFVKKEEKNIKVDETKPADSRDSGEVKPNETKMTYDKLFGNDDKT
jgi:hypothetical protein